jgi:hypothetical protein
LGLRVFRKFFRAVAASRRQVMMVGAFRRVIDVSDKLVSETGDSWIRALHCLSRAIFEFLALAVGSSPNVARHAAKSFFDLADHQIAGVI